MKNSKEEVVAYQSIIDDMVSALTNMNIILSTTELTTLEKTIKRMSSILPNMKYIPASTNLETMQKTIANMANSPLYKINNTKISDDEVLQVALEQMMEITKNMVKIFNIANKENLQKTIEQTTLIIPRLTQKFSGIDWGSFEPTDEDIQIAHQILHSQGIGQLLTEGLSEEKIKSELSNPIKTVLLILMLLFSTMEFIDDASTMTMKEITHNQIAPTVESMKNTRQLKEEQTVEQSLKELNNLLKEKIPKEISHLFMIVNQNNLTVYERKNADSTMIGTLDHLDIVQVFETEKDWARVLCEYRKKENLIEGWVFVENLIAIQ